MKRMTGHEEKACHCGVDSDCLSNLSYGEPLVALSSTGPSFPGGQSPIAIPIPLPATGVTDPDLSVSSLGSSEPDKENSSRGSVKSAQLLMTKLVEIQEVDEEEAQLLSNALVHRYEAICTSIASPSTIPHASILFPKIGRMVDTLVNKTSEISEQSGSDKSGQGALSRASMEMLMSRPTTSQRVLGAEALFIPDDHPLLHMIGNVQSVQGRILTSLTALMLTCVELMISLCDEEANALVNSLILDCLESLILEGIAGPVILPRA